MAAWPSSKSGQVLSALKKIGWQEVRTTKGSHKVLVRSGWKNFTFAFHNVEIGPVMLARIAKQTGLTPDDL